MSTSIIPYSALSIDITANDYFKLFTRFLKSYDRSQLQKNLEDVFIKNSECEHLLATLSVRSSFDLFLQAVEFPKGSEILMTAINIPDMMEIIKQHGYVPVALNQDVNDLSPRLEEIEKAITMKTKAILVSYVFGATFPIDEIVKLCKKHNLYVLEDLAEAFHSTEYNGSPFADLSLFSFGSIKYNTAISGALTIIRNQQVYDKMKKIHDEYPMQKASVYFKKCVKMSFVALFTNSSTANFVLRAILRPLSFDYKEKFVSLVRGFSKAEDFLQKFRLQICTPLLANLAARMQGFNNKNFAQSMVRLENAQEFLEDHNITVPGNQIENRSFWLFPIVVPDPQICYRLLNERGVDAYLGATQLKVMEGKNLEMTKAYFDKIIYLPIHRRVPPQEIQKICQITLEVIDSVRKNN